MVVDTSEWATTVSEVMAEGCVGLTCRRQSFQLGM